MGLFSDSQPTTGHMFAGLEFIEHRIDKGRGYERIGVSRYTMSIFPHAGSSSGKSL